MPCWDPIRSSNAAPEDRRDVSRESGTRCQPGPVVAPQLRTHPRCSTQVCTVAYSSCVHSSACSVEHGHYATLEHGHKSWRAWAEWYAATGTVWLWSLFSSRRALAYRIQGLHGHHRQVLPVAGGHPALPVGGGPRDPNQFRADFRALVGLLREYRIHPVVAERLPLSDARRAHEMLEHTAAKGKLVLVP
ncbi:zinc-binding dehydrogenase [Streptomyces sp. GC420]|uniref:zinc-binding dehydrogenase n=1 Tax=Streptomyces sp. GC420 TaxID=2697568 RepID=UPI0014152EC2|nr:zinc-binding dehydrogenase [Streptomyces sp. GC420]